MLLGSWPSAAKTLFVSWPAITNCSTISGFANSSLRQTTRRHPNKSDCWQACSIENDCMHCWNTSGLPIFTNDWCRVISPAPCCRMELGIPYIIEYNGSEISMARSFQQEPIENEELFVQAERMAFRQATAITVVSEIVKEQVVKAGISENKILVNPNGADVEDYRPPSPDEKRQLRAKMGWTDADVVIGFIGTFGGWHGIEVLAAALPRLCALGENIKFLLIGSGNLHGLIAETTRAHGLSGQVALTGQIPQEEARILMRASDIFVSPHHRDMIDSKFFGSPTKLFEYMATGGAIVASDLEQIGQVLSPALRPRDLENPNLQVKEERAVLCKPGDVDEFVAAVSGLSRLGEVRRALGENARRAAVDQHSWSEHVDKILDFAARCSELIESAERNGSASRAYARSVQAGGAAAVGHRSVRRAICRRAQGSSRFLQGRRGISLSRVWAVDAGAHGVCPAFRRARAGDWRGDWDRPCPVRKERRDRDRFGARQGAYGACARKLRRARAEGRVRLWGRGEHAVRRRQLRRRVQQRRHPPYPANGPGRQRNLPGAQAGRQSHHHGLSRELLAVLANHFRNRSCPENARTSGPWAKSCRAPWSCPPREHGRW